MAITNKLRVENLVKEALRALGGNQHQVDVFNWIEDKYGREQLCHWLNQHPRNRCYERSFHWIQTDLRKKGVLVPVEESGKGYWKLELNHLG